MQLWSLFCDKNQFKDTAVISDPVSTNISQGALSILIFILGLISDSRFHPVQALIIAKKLVQTLNTPGVLYEEGFIVLLARFPELLKSSPHRLGNTPLWAVVGGGPYSSPQLELYNAILSGFHVLPSDLLVLPCSGHALSHPDSLCSLSAYVRFCYNANK